MFLNAYKIHRTHFCSLLQNTTYLLTPKTRKKKKKGCDAWSKHTSLDDAVFGPCMCVAPCIILCTFAHI